LDQSDCLALQALAMPAKDFSFPVVLGHAFEPGYVIQNGSTDEGRAITMLGVAPCHEAIHTLEGRFINSHCNSFHIADYTCPAKDDPFKSRSPQTIGGSITTKTQRTTKSFLCDSSRLCVLAVNAA